MKIEFKITDRNRKFDASCEPLFKTYLNVTY